MQQLKVITEIGMMYDVDTLIVYPISQPGTSELQGGIPMSKLPSEVKRTCVEHYMKYVSNRYTENMFE